MGGSNPSVLVAYQNTRVTTARLGDLKARRLARRAAPGPPAGGRRNDPSRRLGGEIPAAAATTTAAAAAVAQPHIVREQPGSARPAKTDDSDRRARPAPGGSTLRAPIQGGGGGGGREGQGGGPRGAGAGAEQATEDIRRGVLVCDATPPPCRRRQRPSSPNPAAGRSRSAFARLWRAHSEPAAPGPT